jgi:hypothetical protein
MPLNSSHELQSTAILADLANLAHSTDAALVLGLILAAVERAHFE